MKRLVLMVVWCISLVFNLIGSDIYQKGTLKLIPDKRLKPALGWIILAMSVLVMVRIFAQY